MITNSGFESAARIFSSGLKEAMKIGQDENEALKIELQSIKQTMAELLSAVHNIVDNSDREAERAS